MKKKQIDLSERFPMKYRPTILVHEIVARRATMSSHGSMQRIIDEAILSRNSRAEIERLRDIQRKMGHKDAEFYPPGLLRRMGVKVPAGRPRRRLRRPKRT